MILLALASLSLAAAEPGPPARWMDLTPQARAQAVLELEPLPFLDRVVAASGRFLGTPYVESPLGEGEGPDPDPKERYDAVDCLTFVEESLALSAARKAEEIPGLLSEIRYGSEPTYEDRNHLMEAEWIPNNAKKGFVRDVTARYAGADVEWTQKVVTKKTWTSASSRALGLPEARQLTGTFRFPILPLAKVMAHARGFPSGTILLVVREDLALKATRITHLGFVVQKRHRTYLRHAARNGYARVIDEDLETFLGRNSRYAKWRVSGVALLEPLPRLRSSPRPRSRPLPPRPRAPRPRRPSPSARAPAR